MNLILKSSFNVNSQKLHTNEKTNCFIIGGIVELLSYKRKDVCG